MKHITIFRRGVSASALLKREYDALRNDSKKIDTFPKICIFMNIGSFGIGKILNNRKLPELLGYIKKIVVAIL